MIPAGNNAKKGSRMKKPKSYFTFADILLILVCFSLMIFSAAANVLFKKYRAPKIGDRYFYLVEEHNPLRGDITDGTVLFAMDIRKIDHIACGDIILCYPSDDPEKLSLRSVYSVIQEKNGEIVYRTRDKYNMGESGDIGKDKIVAVATGYSQSLLVGKLITFIKSPRGIVLGFVLPIVILLTIR